MDIRLKQRIIGLIVLVVLLIIIIPLLFTGSKKKQPAPETHIMIPKQAVKQSAWIVQLASFSKKNHAAGLARKLRAQGFNVYVTQSKIASGNIYRVLVGPEAKRRQAEALIVVLQKDFNLKGIVIRYKV